VASERTAVVPPNESRQASGESFADDDRVLVERRIEGKEITVAVLGTQGNDYEGTGGRGAGGRIPVIRGWKGTLTVKGEEIVLTYIREAKKKPERFPIEHRENMEGHYGNFIECCRSRSKKTNSPADLAYCTQTALLMGMASLRSGYPRFLTHHYIRQIETDLLAQEKRADQRLFLLP